MYIALIFASTVLFSIQFAANAGFSRAEGGTLHKAMMLSLLSGAASSVLLIFTTGKWEFTWFSFAFALLSAVASVVMTWCSVKVLDQGDLSVYTLFSQIGGMLIPALAGILFYAEPLTWQRTVCMIMVMAATIIGRPVKGQGTGSSRSGAVRWYLAVFILNGVWGVFAKMHQSAPELAVSGAMYSLMIRLLIILISGATLLPILRRGGILLAKPGASCAYAAGGGILNAVGNLILLEALLHVDASIQYPIVTGGMLVLTVVMDRLSGRMPTRRTLLSTAVAFAGLLLMIF